MVFSDLGCETSCTNRLLLMTAHTFNEKPNFSTFNVMMGLFNSWVFQ